MRKGSTRFPNRSNSINEPATRRAIGGSGKLEVVDSVDSYRRRNEPALTAEKV